MSNAFAWLGDIINWFGRFIPRLLIIKATHEGVAFVRGKKVKRLKAGITFYWPLWTEIILYPVKRQSLDLPPQTLTTKDGVPVTASGIMIYEVYDIIVGLAQQWDIAETVRDLGRTALTKAICDNEFDRIRSDRDYINKALLDSCEEELHEFGIKVLKVKLTDFAKTRVFTVFSAGKNHYLPIEDEEVK